MKPSNYTTMPMGSVLQKAEAEKIARNIMIILKRTGDVWRSLSWEEYMQERTKDGHFTISEKSYFDMVIGYCQNPQTAFQFCKDWHL